MSFLKRWFGGQAQRTPVDPVQRSYAAYLDDKSSETRAALDAIVAADPGNGGAQLSLGMLQLRNFTTAPSASALNEALETLRLAVSLLPDSAEAHFYLAVAASFAPDTIDEVQIHLQRALELDSQLAERARDVTERIATTRAGLEAQAIDPAIVRDARAQSELAQAAVRSGDLRGAIAALESALDLYPAAVDALLTLGDAYRQAGEIDHAIATFRRALAVRPGTAEAHIALGSLYVQRGEHGRALEQLRLALAESPNQPQVMRNVGLLQLTTNQPTAALETFARLCELAPDDPDARLHLALAAVQSGDDTTAHDALSQVDEARLSPKQQQLAAQLRSRLNREML